MVITIIFILVKFFPLSILCLKRLPWLLVLKAVVFDYDEFVPLEKDKDVIYMTYIVSWFYEAYFYYKKGND